MGRNSITYITENNDHTEVEKELQLRIAKEKNGVKR